MPRYGATHHLCRIPGQFGREGKQTVKRWAVRLSGQWLCLGDILLTAGGRYDVGSVSCERGIHHSGQSETGLARPPGCHGHYRRYLLLLQANDTTSLLWVGETQKYSQGKVIATITLGAGFVASSQGQVQICPSQVWPSRTATTTERFASAAQRVHRIDRAMWAAAAILPCPMCGTDLKSLLVWQQVEGIVTLHAG